MKYSIPMLLVALAASASASPFSEGLTPLAYNSQVHYKSDEESGDSGKVLSRVLKKFGTGYVGGAGFAVVGLLAGANADDPDDIVGYGGLGLMAGYLIGTSLGVSIYDRDKNIGVSLLSSLGAAFLGARMAIEQENVQLLKVGFPAMSATAASELSRLLFPDNRNLSVYLKPNSSGQWLAVVQGRF